MRYIKDLLNEIKWAWQRVFRGFDDMAYWNLNDYIADIALPVLRWMRKDALSYPSGLTPKKWNKILDTMIKGFEAHQAITSGDWVDKRKTQKSRIDYYHALEKKQDEGLKLFGKWFGNLWD